MTEAGSGTPPEPRIRTARPAPGLMSIVLSRPGARNAQDLAMLRALDEAFDEAGRDPAVKVVIIASDGLDFSAGHDLRATLDLENPEAFALSHAGEGGTAAYLAREEEVFLGLCYKWRDFPKPTIALVQGRCIAAGLMIAWACDLIVAAESATFVDPVVAMGAPGVEWFMHPWELGPRKAKELLFTGDVWTAAQAEQLGMVNRVVPDGDLDQAGIDLATRIASKPAFAVRAVKRLVNAMQDGQGQRQSTDAAFHTHHLAHAINMDRYGTMGDPSGMPPAVKRR